MKTILKIILLIPLLLLISNIFSQSITFKKVFTSFDIDPNNFRINCVPVDQSNQSFIINGQGLTLLKINSIGQIMKSMTYLHSGYYNQYLLKNSTLWYYSENGNNKKLTELDTSFNLISQIQFDSTNSGWQDLNFQFHVDNSVIRSTKDNGFILSGTIHPLIPLILKIDSVGGEEWVRYLSQSFGGIQDIIQTQDSGFAIAANLKSSGASIIKIDKNGDVLWAKSYFRPRGYVHNVLENNDGTMIITGNVDSLVQNGSQFNSSPLFFVKLDNAGNVISAKTFGDSFKRIRNFRSDTKRTLDGGYITLATFAIDNWLDDLLLMKTNASGDTMWVRAHGSPQSFDCGHSIEQLNDNGYIIAGGTNNNIPVPVSSLYLIRTDSLGHTDSLCEEYSPTIAVNNITVNDSIINVTSVPFTITTSIPDTSTQSFTTYAYDGCHLNDIPELYLEQTTPLSIYPNPTDGIFTIEAKMSVPLKTEIEIYDMNCRKVFSGSTNESITNIDLTGHAEGLYFIKLSNERWVKTGKVMVN